MSIQLQEDKENVIMSALVRLISGSLVIRSSLFTKHQFDTFVIFRKTFKCKNAVQTIGSSKLRLRALS